MVKWLLSSLQCSYGHFQLHKYYSHRSAGKAWADSTTSIATHGRVANLSLELQIREPAAINYVNLPKLPLAVEAWGKLSDYPRARIWVNGWRSTVRQLFMQWLERNERFLNNSIQWSISTIRSISSMGRSPNFVRLNHALRWRPPTSTLLGIISL